MTAEQEKVIKLLYSNEFEKLQEASRYLDIAIESMQKNGISHTSDIRNFARGTDLESWKSIFKNRCKMFFEEQIIVRVTDINFLKKYGYIDILKKELKTWLDFIENQEKIEEIKFDLLHTVRLEKEFWILVYEDIKAFKSILEQEIKALLKKEGVSINPLD